MTYAVSPLGQSAGQIEAQATAAVMPNRPEDPQPMPEQDPPPVQPDLPQEIPQIPDVGDPMPNPMPPDLPQAIARLGRQGEGHGKAAATRKPSRLRRLHLVALIGSVFALQGPALAQDNFGDILSGVAQGLLGQEMDRNAYADAQRVNTLQGWRGYLQQFPQGLYRDEAEKQVTRLTRGKNKDKDRDQVVIQPLPEQGYGAGPASVEAALQLSRSQRRSVQGQLTAIGYDAGVADGLWGAKTRDAIARWQSANKLTATGYVTKTQVQRIGNQAGAVPENAAPEASSDQLEERLLGLTLAERREVQRRLTQSGYNTFGTDGVFGQNTRRAMTEWQRDSGLRVSGFITADQLRQLRRDTGG